MAVYAPVPDLGAFSTAEKTALLTAIKAEILIRATTGRVSTGSSSAQSMGTQNMSDENLTLWLNALTLDMGFAQPELRVAPNFNGTPANAYSEANPSA